MEEINAEVNMLRMPEGKDKKNPSPLYYCRATEPILTATTSLATS